MIRLERKRTASEIPEGFRGVKRIARALELLDDSLAGTLAFNSDVWKPAKRQLKRESHGKCAYCEAPTDTVAHGDVEHFRPKSVYWWLAYCYDNYLFSCQICNQTFKGNAFPVDGPMLAPDPPLPNPFPPGLDNATRSAIAAHLAPDPFDDAAGQPAATFLNGCTAERPGLLDPYTVDPAPFLAWEANAAQKEVRAIPKAADAETARVFAALDEFYGLNREELRRVRWKTYAVLDMAKLVLGLPVLDAAARDSVRDDVRAMLGADWPFAGMSRYFVHEVWALDLG